MITSIFKKSKPINFIVLFGFIILVFATYNINFIFIDFNSFITTVLQLLIIIISILLLDFINNKNQLTQKNNYTILTFCLLLGVFPEALKNTDILFSNLFILFGLRRIISLKSNIDINKKLFDAGFWIALAALFYFWSILFLVLVIIIGFNYAQKNIKNALIPFAGIASVIILLICYNIIAYDTYFRVSDFIILISFDYTDYNSIEFIVKLTTFFSSLIWTMVYYFKSTYDEKIKRRPIFILIASTAIIAVFISIISPIKNGSEFLFLFAPFAVIMSNYIENTSERWLKELFVTAFLILAIASLVLQFTAKSQIASIS